MQQTYVAYLVNTAHAEQCDPANALTRVEVRNTADMATAPRNALGAIGLGTTRGEAVADLRQQLHHPLRHAALVAEHLDAADAQERLI